MFRRPLIRSARDRDAQTVAAAKPRLNQLYHLEVGLEGAEFNVAVERVEALGEGTVKIESKSYRAFSHGINKVEFRIRTNSKYCWGES